MTNKEELGAEYGMVIFNLQATREKLEEAVDAIDRIRSPDDNKSRIRSLLLSTMKDVETRLLELFENRNLCN